MSINVDSVDSPVKTCGQVHTFKFTGTITANGAGTVNYYWFRDDTGKYANESLTFTGAGSKAISKDVDVTSTGQYDPFTIQVQVFLTPNESQYSNVKLVRFHNICI